MTNEEDIKYAISYAIDIYEASLKTVFDKQTAKEITINYIINIIAENEAKKEKELYLNDGRLSN